MNECFVYNQKSELFTGENMNYCNVCRQLFNSIYTSKIYVAQNYLMSYKTIFILFGIK